MGEGGEKKKLKKELVKNKRVQIIRSSGEIRAISPCGCEFTFRHILGVGVGSWVEEKGKSYFEMYLLNHC